jgi:hypothetical protein
MDMATRVTLYHSVFLLLRTLGCNQLLLPLLRPDGTEMDNKIVQALPPASLFVAPVSQDAGKPQPTVFDVLPLQLAGVAAANVPHVSLCALLARTKKQAELFLQSHRVKG